MSENLFGMDGMRALRIGNLILLTVLGGCVEVPPPPPLLVLPAASASAAVAYRGPSPAMTATRPSGQHVATTSTAVAYPGFVYPGYPYYAPYPYSVPYPFFRPYPIYSGYYAYPFPVP